MIPCKESFKIWLQWWWWQTRNRRRRNVLNSVSESNDGKSSSSAIIIMRGCNFFKSKLSLLPRSVHGCYTYVPPFVLTKKYNVISFFFSNKSCCLFLLYIQFSQLNLEIDIGARLEDRGKLRIGEDGAPFASAMFENSSFQSCFFLRCPLLLWCSHSPEQTIKTRTLNVSTSCLCQTKDLEQSGDVERRRKG